MIPFAQKDTYLVHLVETQVGKSTIIFTRTVHDAQLLSILLRLLGYPAVPLHGQLSQQARLGSLNKFKTGGRSILVATDVASRGIDIPSVDLVVNYDIPTNSKDYIHRVGRTARAGRSGQSVTLVTQYDVELLQRIEAVVGLKMGNFEKDGEAEKLMTLSDSVSAMHRMAVRELKDNGLGGAGGSGKRKRKMGGRHGDDMDRDDDQVQAGLPVSGNRRHMNQNKRGRGRR